MPVGTTFHDDPLNMGHSGEVSSQGVNANKTVIIGAAGTLDEFVTGKLGASETGVTLPYFLTEPESVYVVKNRPAVLKCKAAHALQVHTYIHTYIYYIKCHNEYYYLFSLFYYLTGNSFIDYVFSYFFFYFLLRSCILNVVAVHSPHPQHTTSTWILTQGCIWRK